MMKKTNKFSIIIKCSVFIAVLILMYTYVIPFLNIGNARKKSELEYPSLRKIQREVKGKVIHSQQSRGWSGTYAIDLSNGYSFSLAGATINKRYKKKYQNLMNISLGDSIYKPKNVDTVYVYRNNMEYYYVLGQIIY